MVAYPISAIWTSFAFPDLGRGYATAAKNLYNPRHFVGDYYILLRIERCRCSMLRFEFVPHVYDLRGVLRALRATVSSSALSFETVSVATWIPRLDYSLMFFDITLMLGS